MNPLVLIVGAGLLLLALSQGKAKAETAAPTATPKAKPSKYGPWKAYFCLPSGTLVFSGTIPSSDPNVAAAMAVKLFVKEVPELKSKALYEAFVYDFGARKLIRYSFGSNEKLTSTKATSQPYPIFGSGSQYTPGKNDAPIVLVPASVSHDPGDFGIKRA